MDPSRQKAAPPNLLTRIEIPSPSGNLSVTTSVPINPPATSLRLNPTTGEPVPLPAILLIHGNSSSSQIFESFFFPPDSKAQSPPLCATHRIIAFDLPGHGASSNSPNTPPPPPNSSHYTMPNYALCALHVLNHLQVTSVVILGWSLGGHIAIELIPLLNPPSASASHHRLKGICLTGTPPVPRGQPEPGFQMGSSDSVGAPGTDQLSPEEQLAFAQAIAGVPFGGAFPPWILETMARTHGLARSDMWKAFHAGEGVDQKAVVEDQRNADVLVAVVNGAQEPFVKLDYLDHDIKWSNLWKSECVRIPGLGHAPFWEDFARFEPIFQEFVAACDHL